jgi:hypothetical protein
MRGFNPFRSYYAVSRSLEKPAHKLSLHLATVTYCGAVFGFFEKRADLLSERFEVAKGFVERLIRK